MKLSSKKRKENVAEYILFMWQLTDLLRSIQFDEGRIRELLVDPLSLPEAEVEAELQWYRDYCRIIREEGKEKSGFPSITLYLIGELHDFHQRLLKEPNEDTYRMLTFNATPAIVSFKEKVPQPLSNDMEYCFYALYSKLLMGMQKREMSQQTAESFADIAKMMGYLAKKFSQFERGEFSFKED
jgi:hypothetical protein